MDLARDFKLFVDGKQSMLIGEASVGSYIAEAADKKQKTECFDDRTTFPQHTFTPDQIPFVPAPPFLNPGAQLAVIEGDPTASNGDYTVRLKMPDGYRIAPHFHPLRENVTVISGTFKVGMGDEFEVHKMAAFTAGSFAFLDPNMHHYAMACGETIVQVHGAAPLQFNYINPSDDPSNHR